MSGSIGGVDASIPLQARTPAPVNPLEQIGQFAGIQNALNAAKFVPGALQLQQQAVTRGQVDQGQLINRASYQALTPLLAKPGPISLSDVTTALGSLEANMGIPTHGVIQHIMEGGPSATGPGFSDWMRAQILSQTQPPESAAGAIAPTQGVIDNNQVIQPTLTPRPGMPGQGIVSTSGQGFGKGLSPDFLAAQVGRQATAEEAAKLGVPIGTPLAEPMVQRLYNQGVPTTAGRATIGAPPPGLVNVPGRGNQIAPNYDPVTGKKLEGGYTTTPPPMPPGARPGGSFPPGTAAPVGTPPAVPTTPPSVRAPVVTGPAPASEREFAASTDQYNQAAAAANSFKTRTFALEQAAHSLENADTGPGSETVNHVKSFLLAQSPDSLKKYLPGVDPDKIQNYDEAVKYLAQYARSQPGAANSDMQSQLAQTANASTHISPAAAQHVVRNTLGLERMNQAALAQFNATHPEGSGQQFSRWLTKDFLPNQDPRGFSWDDMSASQRASSLKAMGADDKTRLLNSVRLARQNGFKAGP